MVNLRNKKGWTLTEMLIVVAIIGVIAAGFPALMTQTMRFYYLHMAKNDIQRDARASLDIINRFLRQAVSSSVVIDQVNSPQQQPPYSRISFTTYQGQNVVFYQQNHTLYQVMDSTVALSSNLEYIAFTYPRTDDPTIISVAVTMSKATYERGTKALELSIQKVRVMN